MGQSFFTAPRPSIGGSSVTVTNFPSPELVNINQATPGTTNAVQVTNLPATPVSTSNPLPVELYGPSSSPITDQTWSGALASILSALRVQSVGAATNRVVEAISAGVETDTLSAPALCSNFMFCTILNNSATLCTYTIGNSGGTTGSVQPSATINFPCDVTKLVLHATAANQQIVGWVYDPSVT